MVISDSVILEERRVDSFSATTIITTRPWRKKYETSGARGLGLCSLAPLSSTHKSVVCSEMCNDAGLVFRFLNACENVLRHRVHNSAVCSQMCDDCLFSSCTVSSFVARGACVSSSWLQDSALVSCSATLLESSPALCEHTSSKKCFNIAVLTFVPLMPDGS